MVLESENTIEIIDTLQKNLNEIGNEIDALSTIRSILDSFITKLNDNMMIDIKVNLLDDSTILEIADSLTVIRPALKEEKTSEALVKANEQLMKLTDRDIRIISLPPMTVASMHCHGDNPEKQADNAIIKLINDVNLLQIKPDCRIFGFNNPIFDQDGKYLEHGYEIWATIPQDLEISTPLVKKHFEGGLYAAYTSKLFNYDEWRPFYDWLNKSNEFTYDARAPYENQSIEDNTWASSGWGRLEEHFNTYNQYGLENKEIRCTMPSHIDFLLPIKVKANNK